MSTPRQVEGGAGAQPDGSGVIALVGLIAIAAILGYFNRQLLPILRSGISSELGWGAGEYSALATATQLASAISLLLFGGLIDRLGTRWAGPATVLLWSFAAILHLWVESFWLFVTLRLCIGLAQGLGTPIALKSIRHVAAGPHAALAFGIITAASTAGMIAAPLVLAFLGSLVHWRTLFALTGIAGLTWLLAWLGATSRLSRSDQAGGRVTALGTSIVRRSEFWVLGLAKLLTDMTWWLFVYWLPDLLHRSAGLSGADVGLPLAAIYAAGAAGSLAGGSITSVLFKRGYRLGSVRTGLMMISSILALPLSSLAFPLPLWAFVASCSLVMCGHQLFSVTLLALLAEAGAETEVGKFVSLATFLGNLGGMLIAAAAGFLANTVGFLPILAWCSATYLVATGLLRMRSRTLDESFRAVVLAKSAR